MTPGNIQLKVIIRIYLQGGGGYNMYPTHTGNAVKLLESSNNLVFPAGDRGSPYKKNPWKLH